MWLLSVRCSGPRPPALSGAQRSCDGGGAWRDGGREGEREGERGREGRREEGGKREH